MRQALLDVHVDFGRTLFDKEIKFLAVDGVPGVFYVHNECFRDGKLVVQVLDAVDDLVYVEIPGVSVFGPKRRVVSLDIITHINYE